MKFWKIAALIMAVCMLCSAFVACDSGKSAETAAPAEVSDKVTDKTISLVVKVGNETKYEGTVTFSGYLGDAIELFTINEIEDSDGTCFDEHGFLVTVCDITAEADQSWTAYFEAEGINAGAINTIRTQSLKDKEDGCTVVLQLK